MLRPTPLADLPPFSDTAAAAIRRQLAARRLYDSGPGRTGRLEAGRLRPLAAPFLPTEFLPGWTRSRNNKLTMYSQYTVFIVTARPPQKTKK